MSNKIVLGSGKLYVAAAVKSGTGYTIPADNAIEISDNLIGWIQGGASIEYTPEFYEAKDDLGMVSKKYLTNEEVILKSGVMTWNGPDLKKLSATARVTTATGKTTVRIGGIGNYDSTQYVIRFVYEDAVDGDIRITIVGSNEAGFEMAFAKDAETVINAEFKAVPCDNAGTLLIFEEETDLTVYSKSLTVGTNGTQAFDDAVYATSNAVGVVTTSVSSETITLTPVAAGNAKVSVYDVNGAIIGYINVDVAAGE